MDKGRKTFRRLFINLLRKRCRKINLQVIQLVTCIVRIYVLFHEADVTSFTILEHRSQNNFLLVFFNTTLHIDPNEPRNEILKYRALHIELR